MSNRRHASIRVVRSRAITAANVLLVALCCAAPGAAVVTLCQQPQQPHRGPHISLEQAPPLMRFIPQDDRMRLSREQEDTKGHTRLGIELATARLDRATQQTAAGQFEAAATELGIYQALLEEVMRVLDDRSGIRSGRVSNKFRDIYKRVELSLRAHGPRLESIRRTTPAEDALNVRAAYEYTRQVRADALNAFYGDTVLRERPAPPQDKPANSGAASSNKRDPPSPEEKPSP